MKKIILTLAIALSTLATFAADGSVSNVVLTAFNKEFVDAKEISWTSTGDFYKASFVFNDQYVFAYYNPEGVFLGMSRNISSLQLPLSLQTSIKRDYKGFWISDLFEVSNDEGTAYYLTLQKGDSKLVLSSNDASRWSTYSKQIRI